MNYNICLTILSVFSTFLSAIATIITCTISKRLKDFQIRNETNKNTPLIYPIYHELTINEWERLYESTPNLDDVIPKRHYNILTEDEKRYCDDTKNHINETYFYYLNSNWHLVFNGRSENPSYIIDHQNAKIVFKNYGALITKLHVDFIEQYFEGKEKPIHCNGNDESYYTDIILPNQEFTIILDEVKNGVCASCSIGKEEYDNLKNWNMFTDPIPSIIAYNKYVIRLSLWNQYNEKSQFEITIFRNGNRFQRDIIQIK